jgi:hypothetical protein
MVSVAVAAFAARELLAGMKAPVWLEPLNILTGHAKLASNWISEVCNLPVVCAQAHKFLVIIFWTIARQAQKGRGPPSLPVGSSSLNLFVAFFCAKLSGAAKLTTMIQRGIERCMQRFFRERGLIGGTGRETLSGSREDVGRAQRAQPALAVR